MQILTPNGTRALDLGRPMTEPSWITQDAGVPLSHFSIRVDPLKMWKTQPSLRKVVEFAARQIAQLPWHAFERVADGDRRRARDSLVEQLLGEPGGHLTGYQLIEFLVIDMMLYDRCAVLYSEADRRLVRLPPRTWRFKKDWLGQVTAVYVVTPAGHPDIDISEAPVALCFGWNDSGVGGTSALHTLADILDETAESVQWRKRQWKDAPKFSGLLKHPTKFRDTKARETFTESWRGWRDERRGTPILEEGLTYEKIDTISPKDAQDLEGRKLTDIEVASAFHIPPELIGAREGNYSNMQAWRSMLYGTTLGPTITKLEQAINRALVPAIDPRAGIYVEVGREAAINGSLVEQAAVLQTMTGGPIMTRAEARGKLNLPYIDGTDELIVPLNVIEGGQASPTDSGSQNLRLTRTARKAFAEEPGEGSDDDARERLRRTLLALLAVQEAALGEMVDPEAFVRRWAGYTAEELLPHLRDSARRAADRIIAGHDDHDDWNPDVLDGYLAAMAETTGEKIAAGTAVALADTDDRDKALEALRNGAVTWAATALAEAAGFGAHRAAEVVGYTRKTWTVTSGNPRSSHAALNGQTVDISDTFSNGARWPGDVVLPVDETAGCTCRCDYT